MEALKSTALDLARRGFQIFPLTPRKKAPFIEKWPERATNDEKRIEIWWKVTPDHNVGLATGPQPNEINLFILDVDVKGNAGGRASLEELEAEHGELPATLRTETPTGGHHYYFAAPKDAEVRNSAGRLGNGLDIRGSRGYVVVPPSVTDKGRYRFASQFSADKIAPAPRWLIALLTEDNSPEQKTDTVDVEISEGQRNTTLTSLAGSMRRRGMGEVAIRAALQEVNSARCKPPLPYEEVARIASSIARYEPKHYNRNDSGGSGSSERKSAATKAVGLVRARAELFHSERTLLFARRHKDGKNFLLDSEAFHRWVADLYLQTYDRALPSSAFTDALQALKGAAMKKQHDVHVRTCGDLSERKVYLNLGNGRIAEITPEDIRVMSAEECPARFWEPGPAQTLPDPDLAGELGDIGAALSLKGNALLIAAGWLLAALLPGGPFPVLAVLGPQGSGKSTRCRHITRLVDPSTLLLRTAPKSEDDLIVSARATHVLAFDNLSRISDWLSDGLCRVATGAGLAKRQLYTDLDVSVVSVKRPVIINAIVDVVKRSDLADRLMLLELDRLTERHTERQVEARFKRLWPHALGAILKGVQHALRSFDQVEVPELPRMADACLWAETGLRGLGAEELAFYSAYRDAHEGANRNIVEADLLGNLVVTVAERDGFEGTSSTLLGELKKLAGDQKRALPPDATRLSKRLRELEPALREGCGVEITFERTSEKRLVKIKKTASSASLASEHGAQGAKNDAGDANDASPAKEDVAREESSACDGPAPASGKRTEERDDKSARPNRDDSEATAKFKEGDRVKVKQSDTERVVAYVEDGSVIVESEDDPTRQWRHEPGDLELLDSNSKKR